MSSGGIDDRTEAARYDYQDALDNAWLGAMHGRCAYEAAAAGQPVAEVWQLTCWSGRFTKRAERLARALQTAHPEGLAALDAASLDQPSQEGGADPPRYSPGRPLAHLIALACERYDRAARALAGLLRVALVQVNACASKKRYDTEVDAKAGASDWFEETGVLQRAYDCPLSVCSGWHLTRKA
jgi:hypothetical protein